MPRQLYGRDITKKIAKDAGIFLIIRIFATENTNYKN